MRTTRDNNEMPQTLLQPFTLSAIIDLICSLRIIGNPAFQNFLSSEKNSFENFFAEYQTSHCSFGKKFYKVILF